MGAEKDELDELSKEIRKIITENERFLARVLDEDFEPEEEEDLEEEGDVMKEF